MGSLRSEFLTQVVRRGLRCFFCRRIDQETRLVNYRVGKTGKRGTYRRRICQMCRNQPDILKNIRGPYSGR